MPGLGDEFKEALKAARQQYGADVEGNITYDTALKIGKTADVIDPVRLAAEKQRQKLITTPAAKAAVRFTNKSSQGELRQLRRAAGQTAGNVRRAKELDPEYKAEALAEIQKAQTALKAKPDPGLVATTLKYGGKALTGTLGVLDAPHRLIRQATIPSQPASLTSLTGDKTTDVSSQQWHDAIRERMGRLERPGDIASNIVGHVGQGIGNVLAAPIAPGVAGLQSLASSISQGKIVPPDFAKAQKGTSEVLGDLAVDVATDPLNAVSFGAKSGATKIGEQLLTVGRKLGVAEDVLASAAKTLKASYAASTGPKESLEAATREIHRALASKVGAKEASRVMAAEFGKNAEFLGREGLKVGVGKVSAEIPVQKYIKEAADALGVAPDLFRHEKDFARVASKRSKVLRGRLEKEGLSEWTPVAQLAAKEGISVKRLGELLKKGEEAGTLVLGQAKTPAEKRLLEEAHTVLARQQLRLKLAGADPAQLARTGPAAVTKALTRPGFEGAIAANATEQARTQAQISLKRELEKSFPQGLPKFAEEALESTHDNAFASMSNAIARFGGESMAPIARVAAWWERQANQMKRSVLMKRPGYHALNVWNDTLQMHGAGMNNPIKHLARADQLLRAAAKGEPRAVRLLGEAQKEGIAVNAAARADYNEIAQGGKELKRVAQGKTPKSRLQKFDEAGDVFAEGWESRAKLAMYLWARDSGQPTWAAARTAFDNLIDYTDRDKALQIMKWFAPFITWAYKMPKVAGRQIAARPARAANVGRAVNALAGENYNEPRSYVDEQGAFKSLPGPLRELYGAGREAVGGTALDPAEAIGFRPRLPNEEAWNLPKAVLSALAAPLTGTSIKEGARPLVSQFGPGAKALFEGITERDLTTGQDVKLKPTGLIPAQVAPPWVPRALTTSGTEHGLIPRHFVNYLPGVREAGPIAPIMMNAAMAASGKPTGAQPPLSYYGYNRPLSYGKDPGNHYYNAFLNFLTGGGLTPTLPEGAVWSAAHSPEVQQALDDASQTKKINKEGRKRR